MARPTDHTRPICGYDVYDGTAVELVDDLFRSLDREERTSIFAINPKKVILADDDPSFDEMVRRCDIRIPDGTGILLSSRLDRQPSMNRVTGLDLMLKVCQRASEVDEPVFLFGGRPGIARKAADQLVADYPDLRIAGVEHGYIESWEDTVGQIDASQASILFVGLGSPLQEQFIDFALPLLPRVMICLGVGGSYDVISGTLPRAPIWARKLRLEWLFRMIRQPHRIRENRFLLSFIKRLGRQVIGADGSRRVS